jgi:hypothetical protein
VSTRVRLPQSLADWISGRLPVGDIERIQFRLRRRPPFVGTLRKRKFAGLTLWNRVYLSESCWCVDPLSRTTVELILHELVHVVQFRRSPFLFPFRYLIDHFRYGYETNPAEVEAKRLAAGLTESFFFSRPN